MSALTLAAEIGDFRDIFRRRCFPGPLQALDVDQMLRRLELLQRLAASLEQELAVHRLAEAQRLTARTLDSAAVEALADMIQDPDGVVVRPDFGRGRT